VIFEGLWCLADREGRLEDRPAKIHFDINPGRAFETTERSLAWLHDNGFILRYQVGQSKCIQVVTFTEHQNPHQKEPPSKIPSPSARPEQAPGKHQASLVQEVDGNDSGPADSGFPLSDSGLLIPDTAHTEPAEMLDFKLAYPDRSGGQPWRKAVKAINARIAAGSTWNEIIEGARRYAAYCEATGKVGTEFVMQAATFVGPDRHYLSDWKPPASKAGVRQNKNLTASQQWLAEQEAKDAAQ
jgi:hypothetical protein